jgi:hypothetical protein
MRDEISIISTNNANYPTNQWNNFFFYEVPLLFMLDDKQLISVFQDVSSLRTKFSIFNAMEGRIDPVHVATQIVDPGLEVDKRRRLPNKKSPRMVSSGRLVSKI